MTPASRPAAAPLLLLTSLYIAQGLPYGFFTQALPVLMRENGASLKAISATSLLFLPWALKFLWAPMVDQIGTRRGWILPIQFIAAIGAALLALIDPARGFMAVFVAVFAFNALAAIQDVATDGLAVRLLDARARGLGNGIQVGAYRIGMVLGGGLLLSLPIAYMQDLLAARPGAGGSLMAVQRVISQGIAAMVFALGTTLGGYGFVAVLSGSGIILAVGFFLWLEREGPRRL